MEVHVGAVRHAAGDQHAQQRAGHPDRCADAVGHAHHDNDNDESHDDVEQSHDDDEPDDDWDVESDDNADGYDRRLNRLALA